MFLVNASVQNNINTPLLSPPQNECPLSESERVELAGIVVILTLIVSIFLCSVCVYFLVIGAELLSLNLISDEASRLH